MQRAPALRHRNPPLALILHRLNDCSLLSLIQLVQQAHILLIQLEIEHVRIGHDSSGRITLRQRYPTLLQTVTDKDLVGILLVLLCHFDQGLVAGFHVANERTVCFDDDVVLVAVIDNVALLAPGMQLGLQVSPSFVNHMLGPYLDLVHYRRPDLANLLDLLNMTNSIITNTNFPDLALLFRLLQRKPH